MKQLQLLADQLTTTLTMSGAIPQPTILEEGTAENGNVMKVRVPFYVGGSTARAPGIDGKLFWSAEKLDGVIAEGNKQIVEGKQPLTVYARHAHALQGNHLPVGRIAKLEREGRIGYSVIDVATATSTGKDVAALVQAGMLNAVSLRTGRYELEPVKVNGEDMLDVTMKLDGIDFAPDSPAMPTYGIEVLAENPHVEATMPPNPKEDDVEDKEITLEAVKAHSKIVAEIEAPLRAELTKSKDDVAKLVQERDALKADRDSVASERDALKTESATLAAEKAEREKESYLREIAAKLPEPEKAFAALQEFCKDAKSKDEIAARAMPVILEGLSKVKHEPAKTAEQTLMERLFPGTGSGQTVLQENHQVLQGESIDGMGVPR